MIGKCSYLCYNPAPRFYTPESEAETSNGTVKSVASRYKQLRGAILLNPDIYTT
jgi:hypothetical protein